MVALAASALVSGVPVPMQNWEEGGWTPNLSIRTGVQYGRPLGIGRHIQLLLEFYRGQSPNGQFYDREIAYLGLGVHLYF